MNLNQPPLPRIFIYYKIDDLLYASEVRNALDQGHEWVLFPDIMAEKLPDWGEIWDSQIQNADIYVTLISDRFLSSPGRRQELEGIIQRVSTGNANLLAVRLEELHKPLPGLYPSQIIPRQGAPLKDLNTRNTTYLELAEQIRALVQLRKNPSALQALQVNREQRLPILELVRMNLLHIPQELLYMPWLEKLSLAHNEISEIENLEGLPGLKTLNLSHNWISCLTKMPRLQQLRFLDLEQNQIKDMGGISAVPNLTTLGLSSNSIQDLNPLKALPELSTIYLARNELKDVSALAGLTKLNRIVLSDNQITSLYPLLSFIKAGIPVEDKYSFHPKESGIFIKGNPIADPPKDILILGRDAILHHFEKKAALGTTKLEALKIILIGNSGVGKTNFSQYLRGEPLDDKHISTHVLDIKPWRAEFLKTPSGEPMLVNIFDFGGQDYYHDLHHLYYSHDTAYVLIWDTSTNYFKEEFEELDGQTTLLFEHYPITYWLESVLYCLHGKTGFDYGDQSNDIPTTSNAPDLSRTAPILVLQNKIDESVERTRKEGFLDQLALKQQFPNIATFFSVSLKTGKRLAALTDVLDSCLGELNLSGRQLLRTHHEVILKFQNGNIGFKVLNIPEFKDVCQSLLSPHDAQLDELDARSIATVLSNLGYIYFDRPREASPSPEEKVFTHLGTLNGRIKEIMDIIRRKHNLGQVT